MERKLLIGVRLLNENGRPRLVVDDTPAVFGDSATHGEPLTAESLPRYLNPLTALGCPTFHVFDTFDEARAAANVQQLADKSRNRFLAVPTGQLRNGEGIMVSFDTWPGMAPAGITIRDWRTQMPGIGDLIGSWTLPFDECQAMCRAPLEEGAAARGTVLSGKFASLRNPEVLQHMQIGLERLPGAYVGALSVSADDLRQELDVDEAVASDEALQPIINRGISKFSFGDMRSVLMDDLADRAVEALGIEYPGPDLADEAPAL